MHDSRLHISHCEGGGGCGGGAPGADGGTQNVWALADAGVNNSIADTNSNIVADRGKVRTLGIESICQYLTRHTGLTVVLLPAESVTVIAIS